MSKQTPVVSTVNTHKTSLGMTNVERGNTRKIGSKLKRASFCPAGAPFVFVRRRCRFGNFPRTLSPLSLLSSVVGLVNTEDGEGWIERVGWSGATNPEL